MGAERDAMLAALRRAGGPAAPLPDLSAFGLGLELAEPLEMFARQVAAVGGALVRAPDLSHAERALEALPAWRAGRLKPVEALRYE